MKKKADNLIWLNVMTPGRFHSTVGATENLAKRCISLITVHFYYCRPLSLWASPLRCNPSSSGPFRLITGVKFIWQQQQYVCQVFITTKMSIFYAYIHTSIQMYTRTWFYRTKFSNVNVASSINARATASLDILLCLLCCLVFYTSYNIRHH